MERQVKSPRDIAYEIVKAHKLGWTLQGCEVQASIEKALAEIHEADEIARSLTKRDVVTWNGLSFDCEICRATQEMVYEEDYIDDGGVKFAQVRDAAREAFKHAGDCEWQRAVMYSGRVK